MCTHQINLTPTVPGNAFVHIDPDGVMWIERMIGETDTDLVERSLALMDEHLPPGLYVYPQDFFPNGWVDAI